MIGLTIQAGALVADAVTNAVQDSDFFAEPSEPVLSESWEVDGVEVAFVEAGGTPCDGEYCWEWMLLTQPDCATANVTIDISETQFGPSQRRIKMSVPIESVTSIVVEATPDDGDYASLIAITCW
ncbi:MAG: hypothetical protein ABWY26_06670 [Microbacterium sp.]